MYITYIYIENFGCLRDYGYSPKQGFNEIYAENGAGKTTLSEFIRAMFYGLPQTRTRKQLDDALRKKYKPWQQGVFGGYIEFVAGSREYRLTRTFADKESEDTFMLIDKATGLVSSDYTSNIGKELFGTDRDTFANTAWISGRNIRFTAGSGLYESLGEGADIAAGSNSFERAGKTIDDAIRYYKSASGKGLINELEYKINNINDELIRLKKAYADLEQERIALEHSYDVRAYEKDAAGRKVNIKEFNDENKHEDYQWKKRLEWLDDYFSGGVIENDELDRLLKENEERIRCAVKAAKASKKMSAAGFALIIIFVAAAFISAAAGFLTASVLCGAALIVLGLLTVKNVKKYRESACDIKLGRENENKYKEMAIYKSEYETLSEIEAEQETMIKEASLKLKDLRESAIKEKSGQILKRVEDLKQERSELSGQLKEAAYRAELLTRTKQFLIKAKESYAVGYMEGVVNAMKNYIGYFDKNLSGQIELDVNFNVNVLSGAALRQADYYSTGIKDIMWLCERFAVIDVLYKKEQPVMLLDDIFVNLDDKMFERAGRIVTDMAQKRQIIYFTCRKNNRILNDD